MAFSVKAPAAAFPRSKPAATLVPSRSTAGPARAQVTARSSTKFWSGFLIGGAVAGVAGVLLAPQISKALLDDSQRLKVLAFIDDERPKDPEQTRQDLMAKINALNASIDDVSAKLNNSGPPSSNNGLGMA